jgi:hypothetical protein
VTTIQAVQRCLDAYTRARSVEGPANAVLGPYAKDRINHAYRRAMPFLTPDPDAIDTFIACVTHGIILQVFEPAEASKLLYAAQIAISSNRTRTTAAKAQTKSHQPQTQSIATPSPLSTKVAEGAAAAPQVPTPSPLPSNKINDSHPQTECAPSTPPPSIQARMAPKAQSAAPQVPPGSTNPVQVLRNQVDELLQQYYTGKFAPEPVPPAKKTPAQAPPPPSPHTGTRGPTR